MHAQLVALVDHAVGVATATVGELCDLELVRASDDTVLAPESSSEVSAAAADEARVNGRFLPRVRVGRDVAESVDTVGLGSVRAETVPVVTDGSEASRAVLVVVAVRLVPSRTRTCVSAGRSWPAESH